MFILPVVGDHLSQNLVVALYITRVAPWGPDRRK